MPRILDLENTATKLISIVDEGLGETAPDLKLATAKEASFLLKQAETFLLRSRESANRIYYNSNLKMQEIVSEETQVLKQIRIMSTIVTISIILLGGGLSVYVLRQISGLIKTRDQAESRYRTVADFTYAWEYWRAPDGKLLYVSPSCERITGYSVNHILDHPNILQEIVIDEDKEIFAQHGLETEREHAPKEVRFRVKRKDGEVIWIEHTCQPVITSTGEFVGYRASNRDISERVEAGASLRESEERYRLLAENMSDFIWIMDLESFKLSYASPSVQELLGYTQQDVQKRTIAERLSDKSLNLVWETLSEEIEINQKGGDPDRTRIIEIEMLHKEGHIVLCETTARFLYDDEGNPNAVLGAARDISAKVQAENALRENEELYRSLVENSPTGILLASPKGEIISVNEATLKIIGSPSKEATKKINLLTFPPIAMSSFAPDFQTCLATGKRVENQMAYTSKWGKSVYVRYALTSISGAKEDLLGIQVLLEDITEQIVNRNDIQEQLKNLATINAINTAIITRTDLDQMIVNVVEEIAKNLSVDSVDLLIFDEHRLTLTCAAQYGFKSPAGDKKTVLRVGEGSAGEAALSRKAVVVENLKNKDQMDNVPSRWQEEEFLSYHGIPLLVKGELKGILEVFHRSEENRDQAWMAFLENLAQQAAIAIDNHFLLDALRGSNLELELAYETTLEGWARALELRDYETKGHTDRVVQLALDLAQELGVAGEELTHFRHGALLHDIGKIAISDTILLKKGPCTPEEWDLIQQHPQYGYDMLKDIQYLKPSLDIVLYHHEKWDGSGYPRGLEGEGIPFLARIFAVIDVWDALVNDRPYHKAWTEKEAIAYIQEEAGKHFDRHVVKAFKKIIG